MKASRIITFFMAIVTAISTYAQKQLTIVNEETVESFEVAVPEGLKIYQYNENWLDSIPYLLEHARNRETWAYENLARCYSYGIGVEKCIINAMIYYDKSGIDEMELAEKAYEVDPTDELGFMNHVMESLDKKEITFEDAIDLIEKVPNPKPSWMVRIKTIFDNSNVEDLEGYIKFSIDLSKVSGDEPVTALSCLLILRPNTPSIMSRPSLPEFMDRLSLVAEKIPMLYAVAGDKDWKLYEDCPHNERVFKSAFEMYHNAYLHGLL